MMREDYNINGDVVIFCFGNETRKCVILRILEMEALTGAAIHGMEMT